MTTRHRRLAFVIASTVTLIAATQLAVGKNGFDLSGSLVPADEIHGGGPGRDGIRSIDGPRFLPAREANFLDADDRVLGLVQEGQARAYPIRIMNWHEVVNDRFGGSRFAVTYCPLCGTGVAVPAESGGRPLTFGVSGLHYNSDMLLYDRETESLWSQIMKQAVTGPMKGQRLEMLPLTHTSWEAWRRKHPNTEVLSTDSGYRRDYARYPYGGYETERGLYFPVSAKSRRYHPKERVLGIEIDGVHKAYPFAELSEAGTEVRDCVADAEIVVRFDQANDSARAFGTDGSQLPAMTGFWFAWYAFHPDTEVFAAGRG